MHHKSMKTTALLLTMLVLGILIGYYTRLPKAVEEAFSGESR
jgi:hypothetical protein